MIPNRRRIPAALLALLLLLLCGAARAEITVTLTFTGDCVIGSTDLVRNRNDSLDAYAARQGYSYFMANFRELFGEDDRTVVSLEGVLSDSAKPDQKDGKAYRYKGPAAFAGILTAGSVEAVSLSNNHTGDYGAQGRKDTKAVLEANGIAWFQDSTPYIYEKDGVRVAFLAAENKTFYQNDFKGLSSFKDLIRELKSSGQADAVVVCWHTGSKYWGEHEEGTEQTAQALIQSGADLLILNHPHVLQGIGISSNRCIFYSLGNFVFGGNREIRTEKYNGNKKSSSLYTAVVRVKLSFGNNGRYLGQQITVFPAYSSGSGKANDYRPVRATPEEAVPVREALQRDTSFELPEITADAEGLSRIELPFLPAFDSVMIPDDEEDAPFGIPEAPNPKPTRKNKSF